MKEEHPIVREARLNAERAKRKADKARDEFFNSIGFWGTVVIVTTTISLALMSLLTPRL